MNKQKKLSNKGFSLVELIIVIAIMAVLIGVLAPAYLSYVEKSKKTTDVQTVNTIIDAMKTTSIDPDVSLTSGDHITVRIGTTTTMEIKSTSKAGADAIAKVLKKGKLKSSKWLAKTDGTATKNPIIFKGLVTGTGEMTFTCDSQGFATDNLTKDLEISYEETITEGTNSPT